VGRARPVEFSVGALTRVWLRGALEVALKTRRRLSPRLPLAPARPRRDQHSFELVIPC